MLLAQEIGVDGFKLGVFLGVDVPAIKAKQAQYSDPDISAFEIINLWRQRTGNPESVKTYRELTQALTDLKKNNLVDFVRSGE